MMYIIFCFLLFLELIVHQAWAAHSQCTSINSVTETISNSFRVKGHVKFNKCWKILTSEYEEITLRIIKFENYDKECYKGNLTIILEKENKTYAFCNGANIDFTITSASYIIINHSIDSSFYTDSYTPGFELKFKKRSFVVEARAKAIAWLKSKRTFSWGWKENTPRAVTALYLAGGANFNQYGLEEELMAKQTALKTSVALLKHSIPNEQLSMFINGLLVTCHNPRQFYGQNLVKRLKDQLETSTDFVHPIVYLTLCNADETWPLKAFSDLHSILIRDSEYPFFKDLQAFSVMAVSCFKNKTENFDEIEYLRNQTKIVIQQFKKHQFSDGSFGNAQTTSLITQALFASGHKNDEDWNWNATLKYLIKEMNASHIDFLSNYLLLPILNDKTLADVSKVNCSANSRKYEDEDPLSEFNDFPGSFMRIQYSLFVGENKDIIHTISLRVPENYTAHELMQFAEMEDKKYKFEWKRASGKMYVYKIGKVTNDPEAGKFWLLYLQSANSTGTIRHSTTSPDQLILKDKEHLILWYEKASNLLLTE